MKIIQMMKVINEAGYSDADVKRIYHAKDDQIAQSTIMRWRSGDVAETTHDRYVILQKLYNKIARKYQGIRLLGLKANSFSKKD